MVDGVPEEEGENGTGFYKGGFVYGKVVEGRKERIVQVDYG